MRSPPPSTSLAGPSSAAASAAAGSRASGASSSHSVTGEFDLPGRPYGSQLRAPGAASTATAGVTAEGSTAAGTSAQEATSTATSGPATRSTGLSVAEMAAAAAARRRTLTGGATNATSSSASLPRREDALAGPSQTHHSDAVTGVAVPPSLGTAGPSQTSRGVGITRNVLAGGKPIEQDAFFADVLFMWIGVEETTYIVFDHGTRRYKMRSGWGSVGQREALEAFQECGLLARQIDEALRRNVAETSFLQQSLRSALRRQLTQYHYLVSTIRERQEPPLVFADLVVAHKRVQPKLWVMAHTLREAESVKGGELASKLQALVQQGSNRLSSLLTEVYIEAVSPLLNMTADSITKGEVNDPFNEFFIVVNEKIDDAADTFWVSKHALRPSMVPNTVTAAVAEEILLVTKNVAFIHNCCRAKQWRMDPAIVTEARRASFDQLATVVRNAFTFSNTAVLRLMREQFKLDDVFRMVNAFLLVGYGDFYELLIRKLDPILSKLSQHIQVSFVRDQVNNALLEITPYAKHLDTERFSTLHCELVKDEAKLGWDAFIITMPLPSPLNNLFDVTAMKVYRRLFRMMFKVKVAEVALKNAWRQSISLDRVIGGLKRGVQEVAAWREVAADAHLLGLELNHFVMNLYSYLVAEVCTVAWDLLMKALSLCKSFDDIRMAHNAYLAYLTQRSLLHTDCAMIRMNIENVLTIVREYCGSQALLTSLLDRGSGEVLSIKRQYQILTDDFHREISALLTTLEEQHLQFDYLNFLLLRLNFNKFYHDTNTGANTEF